MDGSHWSRRVAGFAFTFRQTPRRRADGRSKVLSKLQRRDPEAADQPPPDKIVEAKVLRKRNHPYEPKKVGG